MMQGDRQLERGPRAAEDCLLRLPHPLNLFEFLTRSQHYHLGLLPQSGRALGPAMDGLLAERLSSFRRGGRVLDVGCGMGGSVVQLAAAGLQPLGIDPCTEAVDYARAVSTPGLGAVIFAVTTLEAFDTLPVDGILLTEVLQHFCDLPAVLARCRDLLVPGGAIVVHDPVLHEDVSWERVPHHRAGALGAAAREVGLALELQVDLTAQVAPTLPLLAAEVRARRAELCAFFAARPRIDAEIAELLGHLDHFEQAFVHRYVSYEATVLRRPEQGSR